jgi:hypothetical protein
MGRMAEHFSDYRDAELMEQSVGAPGARRLLR